MLPLRAGPNPDGSKDRPSAPPPTSPPSSAIVSSSFEPLGSFDDDETGQLEEAKRTAILRGVTPIAVQALVARQVVPASVPNEEATITRGIEFGVKPARQAGTPTTGIPALPPLGADAPFNADLDDEFEGATLARPIAPPSKPASKKGASFDAAEVTSQTPVDAIEDARRSSRRGSLADKHPSESRTLALPLASISSGAGDSRPTDVRRDALPPPAAPLSDRNGAPLANASEKQKETVDLAHLRGELPPYVPPAADSVPPQAAIPTPMSMVLAPEDNATRVGPLPTPMMVRPMQPHPMMPAHMPMQAHLPMQAHRRAQPTTRIRPTFLQSLSAHPTFPKAVAFSSGAILVAVVVFGLLRALPSSSSTSSSSSSTTSAGESIAPPEPTTLEVSPTSLAPPPVAALPAPPPTGWTGAAPPASSSPPSLARAEAPRRRAVSRPPPPKPSIPSAASGRGPERRSSVSSSPVSSRCGLATSSALLYTPSCDVDEEGAADERALVGPPGCPLRINRAAALPRHPRPSDPS